MAATDFDHFGYVPISKLQKIHLDCEIIIKHL